MTQSHVPAHIDVVIPVLNGQDFVGDSVRSVLAQDGVVTRAFVVDAGSTDATVATVQAMADPRVTLLHGYGPLMSGAARNSGVSSTTAPWLAFLDADDLWPRHRSARLLAALTETPDAITIGHMVTFADGAAPDLAADMDPTGREPALLAGGGLMHRETFERVGPFDPDLRVGEFIDWVARSRSLGIREITVPTVSLLRRNHSANTSRTRQQDYGAGYLQIALRHRARQRATDTASSRP